ncbi:MAG: hypothetical protein JNL38_17075 [Myxococcales bacterium]|jgi:hypothetical protein|nr:hypothetical protein [Myxococcales bacterium]
MVNKVYGLIGFAGVLGAAALVSTGTACSSSSTSSGGSDSDGGGSSSGGKEGGASSSSSGGKTDGGSSGNSDCPIATVNPADLKEFYKPGTPAQAGACAQSDVDSFKAAKTISEIVTALNGAGFNPTCKACALTDDKDGKATNWAPLATLSDGKSDFTIPSWGTCVAGKSTQACGELEQKFQLCYLVACAKCADADADACQDAAYADADSVCQKMASDLFAKGGCDSKAFDAAEKACGSNVTTHIAAHCVTGATGDAGKD